jgi:hypothetical protein
MATKKPKNYTPTITEAEAMMKCIKTHRKAVSVEKCDGGWNVVRYNVDSGGVAEHTIKGYGEWAKAHFNIEYQRIDKKGKDVKGNRVVYHSQFEAEKEMFNIYRLMCRL